MSEGKIFPPTFKLKTMKRCLFFLALGCCFFSHLFGQPAPLHYGEVNTKNRIVLKTIPNTLIHMTFYFTTFGEYCWVIDGTDTTEYFRGDVDGKLQGLSSRTDSLVILGDLHGLYDPGYVDTTVRNIGIKSIDIENHSALTVISIVNSWYDLEEISIRDCPIFNQIHIDKELFPLKLLELKTCPRLRGIYLRCSPSVLNISDCPMHYAIFTSNVASMIDFSKFPGLQDLTICKNNPEDLNITPCFIDDIFRSLPTVSNSVIRFGKIPMISVVFIVDSTAISTCRDTIAFNKGWSLSYSNTFQPQYIHTPNTYYSCQSDPPLPPDLTNKVSLGVAPDHPLQLEVPSEQPVWVVNGSDTVKRYCTEGKTFVKLHTLSDSVHILGNISALQLGWNGKSLRSIQSNGHTTLEKLCLKNNNFSQLDLSAFPRLKTLDVRNNALNNLSVARHPGLETLDISFNPLSSLLLDSITNLKMLKANNCNLSGVNLGSLHSLQNIDLAYNVLDHITVDSASHLDTLYLQGNQLDACALDNLFYQLPRREAEQPSGAVYVEKNRASNTDIFGCRTYIARDKHWNILKDETVLDNRNFTCAASAPTPNWANCIRLNTYLNANLHFILRGAGNQTLAIVNGPDTIRVFCLDESDKHIDIQPKADTVYIYGDLIVMNLLNVEGDIPVSEVYIPEHTALKHLCVYKTGVKSLDLRHCTRLSRIDAAENDLRSVYFDVCPSLKHVLLMKNELSACGLDSVFHKIPRREAADNSKIFIDDNPGSQTCRDTLASHKNWSVLTASGSSVVNTEYACEEFFMSLDAVSETPIDIYPNPVESGSEFWIAAPQGSMLSLWNMQGICVWTGVATGNAIAIQAPSQSGVYALKIQPKLQLPSAVKVVVK